MESPTGHNAPLDTWSEPCRAKVGVGRRPTTRAERDCFLGTGHTGEATPPGGCTAPPKLSRFTACSPEGYPPHCAALLRSLLGMGEAGWGRGGTRQGGAGPALALPDGNCSSEKEARGEKGQGNYTSGRGSGYGGPRGTSLIPRIERRARKVPLVPFLCAKPVWRYLLVPVPSPQCGAPVSAFP